MKILLAVLGFFSLVSVALLGTCAYIGYRVHKKVEQAKAEYGLDKLTSSSSAPLPARDVCSLLSKEEVTGITGVTITEAHGSTSECTYASETNPNVVGDSVTWQGGALSFKLAVSTVKGLSSGTPVYVKVPGIGDEAYAMVPLQGKDREDFERDLKQDKSGMLRGMNNLLGTFPVMFRKGDVMVCVAVTESHDPDHAKRALAAKIASRL